MLKALTLSQVEEIAQAAAARALDQRAMNEYLHPSQDADRFRPISPLDLLADAAAGAFDSPERARLSQLLTSLSIQARKELIALMFVGRGDTQDFVIALAQAKRTSDYGDIAYLAAKPLQDFLPAALRTLGLAH